MPDLLPSQKQQVLQENNYPNDGSWDVVPSQDGQYLDIVRATNNLQPVQSPGHQQPGYGGSTYSPLQTTAISAGEGTLPALASGAGYAGGTALLDTIGTLGGIAFPEAGWARFLVPIVGSLIAGGATSALQKNALDDILPTETTAKIAASQQENPKSALLGEGLSMMAGGLNPNAPNVFKALGTAAKLPADLLGGPQLEAKALANLKNVALGAAIQGGISGGQNLYNQAQQTGPVDYGQLANEMLKQGAFGAIFNEPNAIGKKLFGFHSGAQEPDQTLALAQNRYQGTKETAARDTTAQPVVTPEQQMQWDQAEGAMNYGSTRVPFSAVQADPETGEVGYVRSYKDVLAAAKKLAPGLVAQNDIPESPLDVTTKVGLDQHTVRQLLDQHYNSQGDSGQGGLGEDSRFVGGVKQALEERQAEALSSQKADDYEAARAEKVKQDQLAEVPGDIPNPPNDIGPTYPNKALTPNQPNIIKPSLENTIGQNQLPPEPPEDRTRLQSPNQRISPSGDSDEAHRQKNEEQAETLSEFAARKLAATRRLVAARVSEALATPPPEKVTTMSRHGEYWQSPDGSFLDATELGHEDTATTQLLRVHKASPDEVFSRSVYKQMYDRGYTRVVHAPGEIFFQGQPNRVQLDVLKNEAIERQKPLIDASFDTKSKTIYDPREPLFQGGEQRIEPENKLTPDDLVPALRANNGYKIQGEKGQEHANLFPKVVEAFKQGKISSLEGLEHGFQDKNGNFLSRDEASTALGQKEPLQSHELNNLQQAQAASTIPESKQAIEQTANEQPSNRIKEPTDNAQLNKANKIPPWADWANRLFKAAGSKRNIRIDTTTGKLYNEKGVEVNGLAYLRDGLKTAVAKMSHNSLDTFFHEPGGHIFFNDLLNSPHPADRAIANRMLETMSKDPLYKSWSDRLKLDPSAQKTKEEFLAQHAGEYFEKHAGGKIEGFKEGVKELVSTIKLRMGGATSEDASRILHNRFFKDPDFYYTHIAPGGKAAIVGGNTEPSKEDVREQSRQFYPTSSAIDKIGKEFPGAQGENLAEGFTRLYNQKQDYEGKYVNPMIQAQKDLTPTERNNVRQALENGRDNKRDMSHTLMTTKEVQAYNKIHDTIQAIGTERGPSGTNQPVVTSNGNLRQFIQNPHYFPSILGKEQADIIRQGKDTDKIAQFKKDFSDHQMAQSPKTTIDKATERWNELAASVRGDLGTQQGTGNQAYFSGIRKQEGITLPPSLRENDLGRVVSSYGRRAVADMAWYKHIENNPEMAASLGYTKTGWGKDLDPKVIEANPIAMGNQKIKDVVSNYRGEIGSDSQFGIPTKNAHALEHLATITMLGPKTQIHTVISSVAQTIGASYPSEALPAIVRGITHNVEGWQHAVDSGLYVSPKTVGDNMRLLLSGSSSAADRLRGLSDMVSHVYTLGGRTDKFRQGFLQSAGEYIMSSRIARANSGSVKDQQFLKYYDPDYSTDKQYNPEEVQSMAARFANTIHGSKDPRTLPARLLQDDEIGAFLKLAHWQVSSTNQWMRNVWTPATKGNLTPLLMSTMGSILGGYAIKKMREEISGGQKTPVPSITELMAADTNKKAGLYGRSLEHNKDLLAYSGMELASLSGFGGIITSALKGTMDVLHKNTFSGLGTVFPLDEFASNTAQTVSKVLGAINNGDTDIMTTIGRATTDWLRNNVQVVQIALNNAEKYGGVAQDDFKRHQYSQRLQDERRYEMASGLPYEDQSSLGSESNPYLTLGENEFKRNMNISQALQEQLPPLLHKWMNMYGDNPQILMQKIQGLKQNEYETEPNPDSNPVGFASYNSWLRMTQGQKEATNRLYDYMLHKGVNEAKASALP